MWGLLQTYWWVGLELDPADRCPFVTATGALVCILAVSVVGGRAHLWLLWVFWYTGLAPVWLASKLAVTISGTLVSMAAPFFHGRSHFFWEVAHSG